MLPDYKDNRRINEMLSHLIGLCPELHGYQMDPEWRDKHGQPEVQPDRVLMHANDVPVGVEFTELLPGGDRSGGSAVVRDRAVWQSIVDMAFADLRSRGYGSLADHLLVSLTIGNHLPRKARPECIARELATLLVDCRPAHDYLLGVADSVAINTYPELDRVLSKVQFAINAPEPRWYADFLCIDPAWFLSAVVHARDEKTQRIEEYRARLAAVRRGTSALYLVLWCRNCAPVIPHVFLSEPDTRYASVFEGSGFDAVWYISGVRDSQTELLGSSWRLYPLM